MKRVGGGEAKVSRKIQRLSAWIHRNGLCVHVEFGLVQIAENHLTMPNQPVQLREVGTGRIDELSEGLRAYFLAFDLLPLSIAVTALVVVTSGANSLPGPSILVFVRLSWLTGSCGIRSLSPNSTQSPTHVRHGDDDHLSVLHVRRSGRPFPS